MSSANIQRSEPRSLIQRSRHALRFVPSATLLANWDGEYASGLEEGQAVLRPPHAVCTRCGRVSRAVAIGGRCPRQFNGKQCRGGLRSCSRRMTGPSARLVGPLAVWTAGLVVHAAEMDGNLSTSLTNTPSDMTVNLAKTFHHHQPLPR